MHLCVCLCVCRSVKDVEGQIAAVRSTKLHSQPRFALMMLALIMFDVPFSHYLVYSSVVGIKRERSTRRILERRRKHNSAGSIGGAASCLPLSECHLIFERTPAAVMNDSTVVPVCTVEHVSSGLKNS